ncbi:MAG: hypothetical protein DBW79_04470 [Cryomorphaceae bacterium]|nr:MAG: hypothetical protein DBW79_04470 [Cryomorphaceae bacterium]|tara:strand:- start:177 stop:533 length:357 start_codon:yes stop_codon:yes gene_type:complete
MKKEISLKRKWDEIVKLLSNKFNDGQDLDIEGVIFLIGLQEFGDTNYKFRKDQKIDLMHIAICRLLEPLGYYQFNYTDEDGWPHYKSLTKLPNLKSGEQTLLMKEAIINYFTQKQLIQ